jgi:chromosome segregation ATPase
MAQAGLLYGVTMAKDGVSKLLSVRLDQVGEGGKVETK